MEIRELFRELDVWRAAFGGNTPPAGVLLKFRIGIDMKIFNCYCCCCCSCPCFSACDIVFFRPRAFKGPISFPAGRSSLRSCKDNCAAARAVREPRNTQFDPSQNHRWKITPPLSVLQFSLPQSYFRRRIKKLIALQRNSIKQLRQEQQQLFAAAAEAKAVTSEIFYTYHNRCCSS